MPPTATLAIDPALLQRLQGVELKSRFLVRGLYASRHRTADHGSSTEFIEHRDYRIGDELRRVDWRVLARTDRLFVKIHEMESTMKVHLLIDSSASMRVPAAAGLPGKLELACVIAGAITFLAEGQQDSIGLAFLGDRIEEFIPARQGVAHRTLLFEHLARPKGDGGGRFGDLVLEASQRLGRRGMAFLLTDALDDPDRLSAALRSLRVREQDATVIQILDRNELDFPFDRMTEFRHPESGARLVGDPASLRDGYLQRLREHLDRVADVCKKAQADFLFLDNACDLTKLLSLHFLRRHLQTGERR